MTEEHHPQHRASDADRDQVAELLGEALADGRITTEEHSERVDRLYAARTHAELAPVTADLGVEAGAVVRRRAGGLLPAERVGPQVAILSSSMARPTGRVEGGMAAAGLLGNARIDLSHAAIDDTGVRITANAVMGAVDIVVPANARVKMTGFPLLGALSPTVEPGPADGPRVEVKGFALLGSVTIHRAEADVDGD
jgi:hypothetical protein